MESDTALDTRNFFSCVGIVRIWKGMALRDFELGSSFSLLVLTVFCLQISLGGLDLIEGFFNFYLFLDGGYSA